MSGINQPFMKPAVYLFLVAMMSSSLSLSAQSFDAAVINKSVKDRVLEVPRMEAFKTLHIFKNRINQLNDVSFEGFCESRRLLFLKASDEGFAGIEQVLFNMNLSYYLKKGTSLQAAKRVCDNPAEIENSLIISE